MVGRWLMLFRTGNLLSPPSDSFWEPPLWAHGRRDCADLATWGGQAHPSTLSRNLTGSSLHHKYPASSIRLVTHFYQVHYQRYKCAVYKIVGIYRVSNWSHERKKPNKQQYTRPRSRRRTFTTCLEVGSGETEADGSLLCSGALPRQTLESSAAITEQGLG